MHVPVMLLAEFTVPAVPYTVLILYRYIELKNRQVLMLRVHTVHLAGYQPTFLCCPSSYSRPIDASTVFDCMWYLTACTGRIICLNM